MTFRLNAGQRHAGFLRVLLVFGCIPASASLDSGAALADALKKHYRLATIMLTSAGNSVLDPGVILAVRKEGIVSFAENDSSYATLCPSEIHSGVVENSKNAACTSLAPKSRRLLKSSELVCVTAIDVSTLSDTVSMFLASCNPEDSGHKSGRNRALTVFHLPAGSLAKMTPVAMERVIDETLSEELPADAAQAPLIAGSPEVDSADQVSVGQTTDEVWANLGPPAVIADLGVKKIYFYPARKIFFTNGKVSSIALRNARRM
jgi:hypothetical protein